MGGARAGRIDEYIRRGHVYRLLGLVLIIDFWNDLGDPIWAPRSRPRGSGLTPQGSGAHLGFAIQVFGSTVNVHVHCHQFYSQMFT